MAGYFELEDLGEFNVKGCGAPQRVHALQGIGRLRTRLDLSRSRGLSRFVGRQEELARLEADLARADAGQAQVVGIVADAGTGNSRLCFEFSELCRARGQGVLEAFAPPHGKNVPLLPLLPVLQLLSSAFGLEERDSAESARDKIAGRVVLRDESLTRALPLLFDLLGVADPSKPPIDAPPELRQREIMNVIRSLLRSRSEQRVGTILIEDLHWLDPGSESFLLHSSYQ